MRLPLEIGKSRGIDVRITEGHAGGRISGGMAGALQDIYLQTLERCRAGEVVHVPDDAPRDVVAIGKCAAALFRGVRDYRDALVIVPEGYPRVDDVECIDGGHPDLTPASFAAGKRLLEFVEQHDDILFLISGGGSACVEWPLPGYTQEQLTKINHTSWRAGGRSVRSMRSGASTPRSRAGVWGRGCGG